MPNKRFAVDLSSNNELPTSPVALHAALLRHWRAGYRVIIVKVSQGTGYTWGLSAQIAKIWHGFGGIVGHYHFGDPTRGTGADEARYFFHDLHGNVELAKFDFVVYDAEMAGVTAKRVNDFIDTYNGLDRNRLGLVYGSPGFLGPNRIVRHGGWFLWLAEYGPQAQIPAGWKRHQMLMWQYTSSATNVPGVPGRVDRSHVHRRILEPRLHRGDNCFAVVTLKAHLRSHGYKGMTKSGKYGVGTTLAVRRFKAAHKITKHPHGKVAGRRVWHLIK